MAKTMKRHTTRKRNRKAIRRAVRGGVSARVRALLGSRIARKEAIKRNRHLEAARERLREIWARRGVRL